MVEDDVLDAKRASRIQVINNKGTNEIEDMNKVAKRWGSCGVDRSSNVREIELR